MEYAINSPNLRRSDAVVSLRRFLGRARRALQAGREYRGIGELAFHKLRAVEAQLANALDVDDEPRPERRYGFASRDRIGDLPRDTSADSPADDSERQAFGTAIVYNTETELLPHIYETIQAGAAEAAIDDPTIALLLDHDSSLLLGRTGSKTLRLTANSRGIDVEARLPRSDLGWRVYQSTVRGDLHQMSFAFGNVDDVWEPRGSDGAIRRILKIGKLYDVSAVTYPAYPTTRWYVRSAVPSSRHSGDDDLNFWRGRVRDNEKKTRRDPELARWRRRIEKLESALR